MSSLRWDAGPPSLVSGDGSKVGWAEAEAESSPTLGVERLGGRHVGSVPGAVGVIARLSAIIWGESRVRNRSGESGGGSFLGVPPIPSISLVGYQVDEVLAARTIIRTHGTHKRKTL